MRKPSGILISILIFFVCSMDGLALGEEASFANRVMGKHNPKISDVFHHRFSHYSEAEPLVNLLETFARSQGMRAAFTENVKGEVSGRFNGMTPEDFLAGIYTAFGVEWYALDDILHFYVKRDLERRLVYLSASRPSEMKQILTEAGLISEQLSCTANDAKKVLVFSGPGDYADGVAIAIQSYEDAYRNEQEIKVFFLKHAWADDTSIGSGKAKKTIPGVASILRDMVLAAREQSSQLAVGTGIGAAVRQTIPPELGIDRNADEVTLEELRQEAKEQMELDRKVASPMHTTARGLPVLPKQVIEPRILADSRSNSVIVRDASFRMPYYEKAIKELDKALDLVEIHAAIVDVDTNYTRTLGVDFGGASNVGDNAGVGAGSNISSIISPEDIIGQASNGASIIGDGFNFSTVYKMGSDYFLAKVSALEDQGDARVLGRPSVLTIDNTSASLETSTTFYIRIVGENVVELKEVSSGTNLTVTPHIIKYEDGSATIKMTVSIEDGQEPSTGSVESDIPAVTKKTNIETQGYISPGQSLLIGGYYYETISTTDSGVPVLMDLPGIGNLFKKATKSVQRMERMVLITPKIIKPQAIDPQTLDLDETKFFRSPYSTESGGVTSVRPKPAGGCSARRSAPLPETQP
ncbi:type III secretion system outer membrane ring subunit SctC [Desulfospira joergensenii]|uniref:type III secretion system outer membrane ring subunit SctC n=1 Tax=Desulfospira joergensenii TaxID=53329 RepID=UPI0003B56CC8|nr:type III secretion system outer membrane ring subunit SctC [Desulfospira joergensenii]